MDGHASPVGEPVLKHAVEGPVARGAAAPEAAVIFAPLRRVREGAEKERGLLADEAEAGMEITVRQNAQILPVEVFEGAQWWRVLRSLDGGQELLQESPQKEIVQLPLDGQRE